MDISPLDMLQEEFVENPSETVAPTASEYTSLVKRFAKLCKPLWEESRADLQSGLDRVLAQAINANQVRSRPMVPRIQPTTAVAAVLTLPQYRRCLRANGRCSAKLPVQARRALCTAKWLPELCLPST